MSYSTPVRGVKRKRSTDIFDQQDKPDFQDSPPRITRTPMQAFGSFVSDAVSGVLTSVKKLWVARETTDQFPEDRGDITQVSRHAGYGKRQRLVSEDVEGLSPTIPGAFIAAAEVNQTVDTPTRAPLAPLSIRRSGTSSIFKHRELEMWKRLSAQKKKPLGPPQPPEFLAESSNAAQRRPVDLSKSIRRGHDALKSSSSSLTHSQLNAKRREGTHASALRSSIFRASASRGRKRPLLAESRAPPPPQFPEISYPTPERSVEKTAKSAQAHRLGESLGTTNGPFDKTVSGIESYLDSIINQDTIPSLDEEIDQILEDAGIPNDAPASEKLQAFHAHKKDIWKKKIQFHNELRQTMIRAGISYLEAEKERAEREAEEAAKILEDKLKLEEATKVKPPPKKPVKKPFVRLPSEEVMKKIKVEFNTTVDDVSVVYKFKRDTVQRGDVVRCLLPTTNPLPWLNDDIINSWFNNICSKASDEYRETTEGADSVVPRYHAYNTQWYPKVIKEGYNAVSRWAKRAKIDGKNLYKCGKVFVPVHQGQNHWTLLVIYPQRKLVRFYDSFNGSPDRQLSAVRSYLEGELKSDYVEKDWKYEQGDSGSQVNGSDCGVYSCWNALATFYTENPKELVPSGAMDEARYMIAAVLINGGFEGDYSLEKFYDGFALE